MQQDVNHFVLDQEVGKAKEVWLLDVDGDVKIKIMSKKKLKTAVTGKVKPGSKAAKRRKSFCARSKGWTGERGKAARRRWRC